jgi:hypothetical protein
MQFESLWHECRYLEAPFAQAFCPHLYLFGSFVFNIPSIHLPQRLRVGVCVIHALEDPNCRESVQAVLSIKRVVDLRVHVDLSGVEAF